MRRFYGAWTASGLSGSRADPLAFSKASVVSGAPVAAVNREGVGGLLLARRIQGVGLQAVPRFSLAIAFTRAQMCCRLRPASGDSGSASLALIRTSVATVATWERDTGQFYNVSGDVVDDVWLEKCTGSGGKLRPYEDIVGAWFPVQATSRHPGGLKRCCVNKRWRCRLA